MHAYICTFYFPSRVNTVRMAHIWILLLEKRALCMSTPVGTRCMKFGLSNPVYDNILSFTPPTVFFTICAYALAKNANDVSLLDKPNTPEWLFGSIISSVCVILCSLTLATSSV